MENINLKTFKNEEQERQFINNQRRVQDFKVVGISTLKGINRIIYYKNLILNLAKPQKIIVKNFKETSLVKVDQKTRNAWESMLEISQSEAKKPLSLIIQNLFLIL